MEDMFAGGGGRGQFQHVVELMMLFRSKNRWFQVQKGAIFYYYWLKR